MLDVRDDALKLLLLFYGFFYPLRSPMDGISGCRWGHGDDYDYDYDFDHVFAHLKRLITAREATVDS